jgi:hypothetical protein
VGPDEGLVRGCEKERKDQQLLMVVDFRDLSSLLKSRLAGFTKTKRYQQDGI